MKRNHYFVLFGTIAAIGISLLSYATVGQQVPIFAGKTSYTLTFSGTKNKITEGYENDLMCAKTDLGNDFYITSFHAEVAPENSFITFPSGQFLTNFYCSAPTTSDVGSIRNLISVSIKCSENSNDGMYMDLYSDWSTKTVFYTSTITDTQNHVYTDLDFGEQAPENLWFMFGIRPYFASYSVTIESIVFTYGC